MAASSDAGPLIWLGKCKILELLKRLYSDIVIPEAVYEEAVLRGLEKGYDDARAIAEAVAEAWISVYKTSRQLTDEVMDVESRLGLELGRGEREAIALALERQLSILLTDDEDACQVAKNLGLDPKGTLYVLLISVKKGYLNKMDAKESLGRMLEEGFWLSPTIIQEFHGALDVI